MPVASVESPAAVRAAARKQPASTSAPVQKSAAKKSTTKKAAKTSATKKAAAKKATKKSTKKSTARNAPATKAAKKAAKAPTKTATAKKAPAKKAPAKKAAQSSSTGSSGVRLPVRAGESPWTKAEREEVRADLVLDRTRLLGEVAAAEHGIQVLLRDGGDGAGNDQADVGSNALERDAEMSLANNSREMLFQVERALSRLENGTYGVCESCGEPIGKLRLMAFPRATLCVSCKQRQERR